MSAPTEPIVRGDVCPLCQRANGCAMASASDGDAAPCWCVSALLDPVALARATALDGGSSCVCAACAATAP
jgi:hypothetical protein